MRFTKMQGIGNDYVYVNCLEESVPHPSETARKISDRHFGVGSDGLILIRPCESADFEMEMYNADGSRSGMCGNGMRCVAKYVYDFGLTDKTALVIASGGRNYPVELFLEDGKAARVKVDMGRPRLRPEEIPVKLPGENVIQVPVTVGEKEYRMTCVSMGNPHCVVCVEDPDSLDLQKIGPDFENLPLFPERVNTEFIRVLNDHTVRMRVWERGAGETLACGTGACASAVACILNGWTREQVTLQLLGGDLDIHWDRSRDTVFMTGPASTVFQGEIDLEELMK